MQIMRAVQVSWPVVYHLFHIGGDTGECNQTDTLVQEMPVKRDLAPLCPGLAP